jgi:hypothetical protein
MEWLLVAIMSMVHVPTGQDIYVFTKPVFESSQECVEYVQENPRALMFKLQMEFPKDKVDKLLCVEKQKVEEILQKSVELDTPLLET